MIPVCALFPGQGSQTVGMGKELCASFPAAAATFDEASDALGIDVRRLCWESGPTALAATENAQPALVTCAVATWRALAAGGVTAAVAAGHSVGALGALTVAGCMDFADAVALARRRGELMAAVPGKGVMFAVLVSPGMPRERLDRIAQQCGVDLAADNSSRQVVYSGEKERMLHFCSEVGSRTQALRTTHAFHSRMMKPAEREWVRAVSRIALRPPGIPVALPSRGGFATDVRGIRTDLVASLCSPVKWRQVVAGAGPHPRVALGPARALTLLERDTHGRSPVRLVDGPAAVTAALEALRRQEIPA